MFCLISFILIITVPLNSAEHLSTVHNKCRLPIFATTRCLHHFESLYVYVWHICGSVIALVINEHWDRLSSRYFTFILSVVLHQCSVLTLYSSTTCAIKSQWLRVLQSKKFPYPYNFALLQKMPYYELLFYICLLVLLPYDWVLWNTISSITYQPGADDGNIKGK